ncbi:MAG: suppressor of fused domain protein [bacterium]
MNLKEFKLKVEQEDDWAPGWEAIENAFSKKYDKEPLHYVCTLHASMGGNDFLNGTSIYQNESQEHLVTFGMSELFVDEECFGDEYSGWGYEMTAKWSSDKDQSVYRPFFNHLVHHFARYTFTQSADFSDGHVVICNVANHLNNLGIKAESNIAAFVSVYDTEIETLNTCYGEVMMLQLIGLTHEELELVREDMFNAYLITEKIRKDNPLLLNDLLRKKSYLL